MKLLCKVAVVLCLVGASRFSALPESYYVRLPWRSAAQVQELVARGFDIAGVNHETKEIAILTDEVGVGQLSRMGVRPTAVRFEALVDVSSGYKKPSDIEPILKQFETDYPQLAKVHNIGRSNDGRDIFAIQITDFTLVPLEEKAVFLVDAMHHARELMTPEIALDVVEQLTHGYATDTQIRTWLARTEVWVIPMLNPDGNDKVWTASRSWRKNTRGGYGVDNNRNYPADWGKCQGSSGSMFDMDYRGPSAGSEPETQALMNLAREIRPLVGLSVHSASEMVLYPYGCSNHSVPMEQRSILEGLGRSTASKIQRDSGNGTYSPGTPWQLLYNADGGSMDWLFDTLGTYAYAFEVSSTNQGFSPSYAQWRESTVKRVRAGWKHMLERVNGPSIRVRAATGEKVTVLTGSGSTIQTRTADSKGWVQFLVPSGSYQVRDAAGQTRTVTVGTSRAVLN